MAEAGTGADIVHPKDERMSQSVSTLRTALLTDGYTAAELSSMTKNDMVYADDLNLGREPEGDRQDPGFPIRYCTSATEGEPGELLPAGCIRPADAAAMNTLGVVADPDTDWAADASVFIYDDAEAHWDGTEWVDGAHP